MDVITLRVIIEEYMGELDILTRVLIREKHNREEET